MTSWSPVITPSAYSLANARILDALKGRSLPPQSLIRADEPRHASQDMSELAKPKGHGAGLWISGRSRNRGAWRATLPLSRGRRCLHLNTAHTPHGHEFYNVYEDADRSPSMGERPSMGHRLAQGGRIKA